MQNRYHNVFPSGGDIMVVRRKIRVKWFRLIILMVIGYSLYVFANQHLQYIAISRETEASQIQLEQLKQVNEAMVNEKQKLSTDAYVEKLAREELGLVKPGEVPYVR